MTDPLDFSADGVCTAGDPEWLRRLALFMADPSPMEWWWLSFTDPDRPKGQHFLGLCIVPAPNVVFASRVAWMLGCNPGGQIAGYPACPPGWRPKPDYVGRLFTGDDARALAEADVTTFAEPG